MFSIKQAFVCFYRCSYACLFCGSVCLLVFSADVFLYVAIIACVFACNDCFFTCAPVQCTSVCKHVFRGACLFPLFDYIPVCLFLCLLVYVDVCQYVYGSVRVFHYMM